MELEKEVAVSQETKVDIKFAQGKMLVVGEYQGKGAGAKLELSATTDYFLDKLAAAIPGTIDDAVISLIKNALNKL